MTLSAPAVLVLTLASPLAWAGESGLRVLPIFPSSDSDGYSMAAPQAAAAEGKLNANIEARAATNCTNAWQVFTDFDAMARFLPGMESSKVLSREGGRVTVQQRGRHQYGIFSKRYESKRELTMNEPALIESRSLPGDEMAIASSTSFTPTQRGGCAIAYSATIDLPTWVPRVAAIGFVKSLASTQMRAMLAEVKHRYLPAFPATKAQAWRLPPDAPARSGHVIRLEPAVARWIAGTTNHEVKTALGLDSGPPSGEGDVHGMSQHRGIEGPAPQDTDRNLRAV